MAKILPVIMCGGSGSRLWPVSRKHYPKQFLNFGADVPMIIQTAQRVQGEQFLPPLIIANEEHRFLVSSLFQKAGLEYSDIILEPVGRNTAPAACVAAFYAQKLADEHSAAPLVLLLPADHLIQTRDSFQSTVAVAGTIALSDKIVTFGITPTHPETGYGYIKAGAAIGNGHAVERFVEKPDMETAQSYLVDGGYFWNGGIFLFSADFLLQEMASYAEDVKLASGEALARSKSDQEYVRLDLESFSRSPDISIDYAVMEKTNFAVVVKADFSWSDVGSWKALWDVGDKNPQDNIEIGDVVTHDVKSSYIYNDADCVTSVMGLDEVVVVVTSDAVLVTTKENSQGIKTLVDMLKEQDRDQIVTHQTVHRPWGRYRSLAHGSRYQVKEILVNPGASLSLQYHHHRAEHWVVVEGTAEVTRGEDVFLLSENQSTFIELGQVHRLRNPGKVELKIVEVQSGCYLGEDDIERLEDDYDRHV